MELCLEWDQERNIAIGFGSRTEFHLQWLA